MLNLKVPSQWEGKKYHSFINILKYSIYIVYIWRVVPCMLVGNGALKWARDNNITEVSEDSLKTGILLHALYIL